MSNEHNFKIGDTVKYSKGRAEYRVLGFDFKKPELVILQGVEDHNDIVVRASTENLIKVIKPLKQERWGILYHPNDDPSTKFLYNIYSTDINTSILEKALKTLNKNEDDLHYYLVKMELVEIPR